MFRINISEKNGKTYHIEAEAEGLVGKQLNDKVLGAEISPELSGYEFEISGASDKAGFPVVKDIEGIGMGKILTGFGIGMKKRPKKELKKKRSKNRPMGLRMRKSVRGKVISENILQINLKILKDGSKKLSEVFPDQNLPKEKKVVAPVVA